MPQLTKTRAAEILKALPDRYVLVLGDVMLDEFVWGDVTRISPEAPVPVVDVRRESVHLGGGARAGRRRAPESAGVWGGGGCLGGGAGGGGGGGVCKKLVRPPPGPDEVC